jgi:hypothetical protein
MHQISVRLIEDPELRTSLRNLYPDAPEWARKWLIPTPGAPLAAPPETPKGDRVRTAVLLEELEATRAAINATNPITPWVVQCDDGHAWIGRPGSKPSHRLSHQAAEGCIVSLETRNWAPKGKLGKRAGEVTLQYQRGRLSIALGPHGKTWHIRRKGLWMDGIMLEGGKTTFRYLKYTEHEKGADGTPPPPNIMADGTDSYLSLHAGLVHEQQTVRIGTLDRDRAHQEASLLNLLRRWEALTSEEDRARITAFWLGHRHPVLAAAGLASATGHRAIHAPRMVPS